MTQKEAQALQRTMMNEALGLMMTTTSEVDTTSYEKAIRLIGKAWHIPEDFTLAHLDTIRVAKESPDEIAADHSERLNGNARGKETLDNIWGLFETAVQLSDAEERNALYCMGRELEENQNLQDWIRDN